jgi:hypothetical protein
VEKCEIADLGWGNSVDAHSLSDHFVQFTHSADGPSARRSFLQLVWLVCVWVVWNERNLRVFHNSENSVHPLLDKVKLFSYRWLRTTNITLVSNIHCWWSTPSTCLGIDWLFLFYCFLDPLVNISRPPQHTLCWGSTCFCGFIYISF